MGEPVIKSFDWEDPFGLDDQLTDEERMVRDTAENYAQNQLQPRVTEAYLNENFDREIMREMGQLGLLGATVSPEYGGAGLGYVSYGLIARAVERVDSGYRSAMSVQSSLVMHPINAYGSDEQKKKYLPGLASGELVGCFGLTEPDAGSDPGGMRTRAEKVAGGYRLKGAKMWITNSPIADVFVVWAKSEAHGGAIRGFVLEKGMTGLSAPKIKEKLSLRASITGEIVMDDVEVGEDALLPQCPVSRVRSAASIGRATASAGVRWVRPRPASPQLANIRSIASSSVAPSPPTSWSSSSLPTWSTEITLGLQAALRVGRRLEAGELIPETISLIKRNNCGKALDIARIARDMHGGNGISRRIPRHAPRREPRDGQHL